MKRGVLIVLFIIVVLAVAVFFLQSTEDVVTGDTASDIDDFGDEEKPEATNSFNECVIDFPFFCNIWSFDLEKDMITLQIVNLDNEDYLIKSFEVSGCRNIGDSSGEVQKNGANSFALECDFENGKLFSGKIGVSYKRLKGGETQTASGSLLKEA